MTNEEAVRILRRIQEPEAWEPQINGAAFEALDMAIEAFGRQQAEQLQQWQVLVVKAILSQLETTRRIVGKSKGGMTLWYECERCGEPVDQADNFCRNCGRRFQKDGIG